MSSNEPQTPRTVRKLLSVKLAAFVLYVLLLTGFTYILAKIMAPETVVVQGMWMITYVVLLVIGGQAAIDALVPVISKVADAIIAWKSNLTPKP